MEPNETKLTTIPQNTLQRPQPLRSVSQILSSKTPLIRDCLKTNPTGTVVLIVQYLVEFNSVINCGVKMTAEQCGLCAKEIVDLHGWWKPEDIELCLKKAARGDYGPLVYKVDQSDVLGWLNHEYREHRLAQSRSPQQTENPDFAV